MEDRGYNYDLTLIRANANGITAESVETWAAQLQKELPGLSSQEALEIALEYSFPE